MSWKIDKAKRPSKYVGSILATMNYRKLASKDPIFNIESKDAREILAEFLEEMNFLNLLKKTFYRTSLFGHAIWVITKWNDEWKLIQANNVLLMTKDATDKIISMTILAKIIKGSAYQYWVFETHTPEGIIREVTQTDNKTSPDPTRKQALNAEKINTFKLYQDTKIVIKPYIATGVMTAFLIANQFSMDDLAIDGVSDSLLATTDIDILDDSWENLKYVLRFARPRLIISKEEGTEIIDASSGDEVREDDPDGILEGGIIVINKSLDLDSEGNSGVSAFVPNPQVLFEAHKSMEKSWNAVLNRAGFAGADDADSAQKSTLEVSQIRDSELAAMEDKISIFQSVGSKVIKALGKVLNLEITEKDGIELQRLDVRAEMEMVDNLIKAVNAGFEPQVDAVSKYKKISPVEAETVMKKIKEEREAAAKVAMNNNPVAEGESQEEDLNNNIDKEDGTTESAEQEGENNDKNNDKT